MGKQLRVWMGLGFWIGAPVSWRLRLDSLPSKPAMLWLKIQGKENKVNPLLRLLACVQPRLGFELLLKHLLGSRLRGSSGWKA